MPSYSGVWTLQAQMQAVAAGNWPKPPFQGELYAWGYGFNGMLGLNDTANRSSPVQVGALNTWSQIGGGTYSSLAVKVDGTFWSWGYNSSGQLGQNNTTNSSSPVQVGALTTWYQPSSSTSKISAAVKTDGTLWSWGLNTAGALGLGDAVSRSSPVQVGALTTWAAVSAISSGCAAIKTDGTLWVWGKITKVSLVKTILRANLVPFKWGL